MPKRVISLLLTAGLLASLAACREEPSAPVTPAPTPAAVTAPPAAERQEFALPWTGAAFHPILSRDRLDLALSGLVWEGLFALDQKFEPQKVLCEDYTVSEDGLVWTFTLKGVSFSDGTPLTAAEAAASLELARQEGSRFAARLTGVRSVTAREERVIVTLTRPNGALPALLDIPIVKGDDLLGTGPYVLEGEGPRARLSARRSWWSAQGRQAPVQYIPLRTVQGADDLIYAFGAGEISLVTADLTASGALGFSGNNQETWDCPGTGMVFVGYNCARGLCADPALRRVLSRGFDRNTVAAGPYDHHAVAAALPVHPGTTLYDRGAAEVLSYSPQALADGLAELGWEKNADGILVRGRTPLSLVFVVNTDNSFRLAVAEYLTAELGKAGAAVELKKLNWTEYQKALAAGEFDLYLGAVAMTGDFDPAPLVEWEGSLNYGRYLSGEEVAQRLAEFQRASGRDRDRAAAALYQALGQDAPFTALCFKNQSVLTRWGMVDGIEPTQANPFYGIENWRISS